MIKVDCKSWYNSLLVSLFPKYFVCKDAPGPEPGPGPAPTGPLVDPNPAIYTQAYMDANGRKEEVGLEEDDKIITRYCAIRGQSGGFWMLSSLGRGHVRRAEGENVGIGEDFVKDGFAMHVKGYVDDEPQQGEIQTMPVSATPKKYIVVEIRKATMGQRLKYLFLRRV